MQSKIVSETEKPTVKSKMFPKAFGPFFVYPLLITFFYFVFMVYKQRGSNNILKQQILTLEKSVEDSVHLNDLYKKTSTDYSACKKELDNARSELKLHVDKVNDLSSALEKSNDAVSKYDESQKALEGVKNEMNTLKKAKDKEIEDRDAKIKALEESKVTNEKAIEEKNTKIKTLEDAAAAAAKKP